MKKLLDQLGTVLIVTVVTLLVWLYAEDANIVEYTSQPVRLQFVASVSDDVLVTPGGPITVQVDFNASNSQQQQVADKTREGLIQIALPLTMDKELDQREVDLRLLLEENVFRDLGVNITDVRPMVVTVGYEKKIDWSVPLEIEVADGVELAEPPRLINTDMRTVTIAGLPASRKKELERLGVTAKVVISPQDLTNLEPGAEGQVSAKVVLSPRVEGVVPSADRVDLLVRRANDRGTITIDRRPILLSYPSSINERYIVSIDESARFITSFELEGPRSQIELLKQDPTTGAVWASVRLTNEEADAAIANGGEVIKQVDIVAPQGVVLSSEVVRATVKVTLRESRETPGP